MELKAEEIKKKRILICMDWYEPGYKAGGPIRSVSNIVKALKNDFEFFVLTSAFDLGATTPYPDIPLDQWFEKDGVIIKYMSKANMKPAAIKSNILEVAPDVLYLNSLFSKLYTLVPMTLMRKVPVIIAPRGMLGKGALDIKKNKKSVFLKLAKWLRLFKKVTWHASTEHEAEEVRKNFGSNAKIVIAQNIPAARQLSYDDVVVKRQTGAVRFIFISRIAKKKNLHLAIQAAKRIKSEKLIEFHIHGNIEEEAYFNKFKEDIKDHGNIKIEYRGVLNPALIPTTYLYADYMVLPTMHENYGHAIVEAWACGVPVIISKNTPWRDLRAKGLGWDVDLKPVDELARAMQEAADISVPDYLNMVKSSFRYFEEHVSDHEIIKANQKLFEDAS